MSRGTDDSEFWVALSVVVLCVIAIWGYFRVQALATWMNVDMSTAFSVVLRTGFVLIVLILALVKGWFGKVMFYIPAAALVVMAPALTFWSWAYVQPDVPVAMNPEPLWYGVAWIQVVSVMLLATAGFFAQQWYEEN